MKMLYFDWMFSVNYFLTEPSDGKLYQFQTISRWRYPCEINFPALSIYQQYNTRDRTTTTEKTLVSVILPSTINGLHCNLWKGVLFNVIDLSYLITF
jgi:hypothetical protein